LSIFIGLLDKRYREENYIITIFIFLSKTPADFTHEINA
jgi:hypothetical protein